MAVLGASNHIDILADPTIADAIYDDRLVHNAHVIALKDHPAARRKDSRSVISSSA